MDLKNKNLEELKEIVEKYNQKSFLSKEIFKWIHQKYASSIDEMTNLSKDFRSQLKSDSYYISNLKILKKQKDNGGTIKFLFETEDGSKIEAVILDDEGRKTLCLSCQVGCRMGCKFCATGQIVNYTRNLTAAEMVDQVYQIEKSEGINISNVVYMGMGEPFDNYDEVMKSVRILNDKNGKNLGARRMTLSTCGIIPGVKKLAEEQIQVRLAISLHSCDEQKRKEIMPIAEKYSLSELKESLKEYQKKTKRRMTIEYVLMKDFNDRNSDTEKLITFLRGLDVNINLIEYNDFEGSRFKAPSRDVSEGIRRMLENKSYEVSIRYKRGRDIKAACGQLVGET